MINGLQIFQACSVNRFHIDSLCMLCIVFVVFVFSFEIPVAFGKDLLGIYELALHRDTKFSIAESKLNAAHARLDQSVSQIKPQVKVSAALKGHHGTYVYTAPSYGVTLTQSLFDYDQWKAIDEAEDGISQSAAEFEEMRQDLIIRVVTAYFNLLAAQNELELAKAEKDAAEEQLNQMKVRFEGGFSTRVDLLDAQAAYDLAVTQGIMAKVALANAKESVYIITGKGVANVAKFEKEIPLVTPEPHDIDVWVELSLKRNLDVIAKRAALDATREALTRAKSGYMPTVDLIAGHVFSDNTGLKFGIKSTDNYIGLELSSSIYSGGLTTAKVREATDKVFQAEAELEQARREAVKDCRNAYLAVQAGIAQVRALQGYMTSTNAILMATQEQFYAGKKTEGDLLNARRDMYNAKVNLARARYDYLLSVLTLKQAVGRLNHSDVGAIDKLLE